MNFDLTEEQLLLKDSIARFAAENCDLESRRKAEGGPAGNGRANWRLLAELGVLGFPIAEEAGGLGGSPADIMVTMEALGHAVAAEPVLDVVVLGAGLLAEAGNPGHAEWIESIVAGERQVVLAHAEASARYDWAPRETRVSRGAEGLRIDGEKSFVPQGGFADAFVVTAREPDGTTGLYLLPADRPGLTRHAYRAVDGSYACALVFDGVSVEEGDRLNADQAFETVVHRGALAASAETLGIMARLFEETLSYVQTRQQFGTPIGSFQVVQHKMARLSVLMEQGRSILLKAVLTPEDERVAWLRAAAGAKAFLADASIRLAHECVQLHGGMGITDELIVGHGHKRLMVLARWFGDDAAWRTRYSQLLA